MYGKKDKAWNRFVKVNDSDWRSRQLQFYHGDNGYKEDICDFLHSSKLNKTIDDMFSK